MNKSGVFFFVRLKLDGGFETSFIFIGGEDSHFDVHIFQMGWFNHQPGNVSPFFLWLSGQWDPELVAGNDHQDGYQLENRGAEWRNLVGVGGFYSIYIYTVQICIAYMINTILMCGLFLLLYEEGCFKSRTSEMSWEMTTLFQIFQRIPRVQLHI